MATWVLSRTQKAVTSELQGQWRPSLSSTSHLVAVLELKNIYICQISLNVLFCLYLQITSLSHSYGIESLDLVVVIKR